MFGPSHPDAFSDKAKSYSTQLQNENHVTYLKDYIDAAPPLDARITNGMIPKKKIEVHALATIISSLCKKSVDNILDLGSGQGYLDSCLVFTHGMNVIGVDDNFIQTCGAKVNAEKIYKRLNGKPKPVSNIFDMQVSIVLGPEREDGTKPKLVHVNRHVHPSETFSSLLESVGTSNDAKLCNDRWALCGLHTCGEYNFKSIFSYL
jgi:hypothetical protein